MVNIQLQCLSTLLCLKLKYPSQKYSSDLQNQRMYNCHKTLFVNNLQLESFRNQNKRKLLQIKYRGHQNTVWEV